MWSRHCRWVVPVGNTVYFGPWWDAPLLDRADQAPTPVGQPCLQCAEPIVEGDRGLIHITMRKVPGGPLEGRPEPIHAECNLIGVIGHQVGVCRCHGYDTSTRAAAQLAWKRVGEWRGRDLGEANTNV